MLRLVKVALSFQSGEGLELSKKTDLILKELSRGFTPFPSLCTHFWDVVDKELTLLAHKKVIHYTCLLLSLPVTEQKIL